MINKVRDILSSRESNIEPMAQIRQWDYHRYLDVSSLELNVLKVATKMKWSNSRVDTKEISY